MPNNLPPRKLTLAAGVNTRLDSLVKRRQLLMTNDSGAVVGITPSSTETTVGNCYPVADGVEFKDVSNNPLYGVSAAGGDVYILETDN